MKQTFTTGIEYIAHFRTVKRDLEAMIAAAIVEELKNMILGGTPPLSVYGCNFTFQIKAACLPMLSIKASQAATIAHVGLKDIQSTIESMSSSEIVFSGFKTGVMELASDVRLIDDRGILNAMVDLKIQIK